MLKVESKIWKNSFAEKFSQFKDLRSEGMHCDIILRTKDGSNLNAHRIILHIGSRFFENLFSAGMSDSTAQSINLTHMKGENLNKIIDFMYCGEMEVNNYEEIEVIMQYANYLQIAELIKECTDLLSEIINDDNCLKYWRLAHECFQHQFEDECISYILTSTKNFFKNESLLMDLEKNEIIKLLQDDRLKYTEEFKLKQIIRWSRNTTEDKEEFTVVLCELLEYIQFALMSNASAVITSVLTEEDLIKERTIQQKIFDLSGYEWDPSSTSSSCSRSSLSSSPSSLHFSQLLRPSQCRSTKRLFAIFNDEVKVMSDENDMNNFILKENSTRWFGHTTFNNFLLISGGVSGGSFSTKTNQCEYFNPNTKEWKYFPSMKIARHSHESIFMDNKIYSCGGNGEYSSSLSTVEIFDFGTEQWSQSTNMGTGRRCFGLTSLNRSIYAIGGKDVSTIEMHDPRVFDGWIEISSDLQMSVYTQCVAIGTNIYCFQRNKLPCIIDTRMNEILFWEKEGTFAIPENYFKVCEANECFNIIQKNYDGRILEFHKYSFDGALIDSVMFVPNNISITPIGALVSLYH